MRPPKCCLSAAVVLGLLPQAHVFPAHSQDSGTAAEPPPWPILDSLERNQPLPGTAALTTEGDLASQMVAGIDAFLLEQIKASVKTRQRHWKRDTSSPEAYAASVEPNRQRLRERLGMVDERVASTLMLEEPVDGPEAAEGKSDGDLHLFRVRWQVLEGVSGTGLLLLPPAGTEIVADVICLPDAAQRPEDLLNNSVDGTGEDDTRLLARSGCRVLVPLLINRDEHRFKMSNREWLHRPAYELGRTLAGYEVQKVLAAVDALREGSAVATGEPRPIGVIGWGEGGRLALYAGALDTRIAATAVGGYFNPRQQMWNEPADRNVFGLLREFGDAEIASLVAPRSLGVQIGSYPVYTFRPDAEGRPEMLATTAAKNGKPGTLFVPANNRETEAEFARLLTLLDGLDASARPEMFPPRQRSAFSPECLEHFLAALGGKIANEAPAPPSPFVFNADHDERHARQLAEIERHNQRVLQLAYQERIEFMKDLDTSSLEAFEGSVERYREIFRDEVIGRFDVDPLPANPRSRPFQEGPLTVSHEVVLDVFPGVFAYGILTLPKDLPLDGSEKRPVVVCQHGLEGRPQDVVGESKYKAYKAFATRLAERGFITFAPQNPYLFHDRFRTLQFKANAVGCTLFSIIVPQHQAITDWLQGLPFVDGERIGFYGLSYGGKSAMRIPPLVDDYCLSICSADFNEWVWKNAATDERSLRYSYANKREYEIFEFGLGRTFNYAEMAALICPRPFMVERGHFDGVGPDDRVAQEFAKVRFLYQAQLGIGDRVEIEWFPGPHTINGVGSFDFLHRHLDWPAPE